MTLKYETGRGVLLTSLTFAHTVLPSVVKSTDFWLFLTLHLLIFFSYRVGAIDPSVTAKLQVWGMNWDSIKVVTSMTTFFEVFYSNTCYARYTHLYKSTRDMLADSANYAYVLRTFMQEKAPEHAHVAARYMMAGVMLHFYDVRGMHAETEHDMSELRRLGLVDDQEMRALLSHQKHSRPIMMLQWSMMVAREGCLKASDNRASLLLSNLLIKMRTQQQDVVDTMSLQVPFQYFHLLSVMIIMNLAMWAYAMALTDSVFAPVVYICCSVIFIGMMELASQLSDPFGDDVVDFDIDGWLADTYSLVVELTENQYPGGTEGMAHCLKTEGPLPQRIAVNLFHPADSGKHEHAEPTVKTLASVRPSDWHGDGNNSQDSTYQALMQRS